MVTACENKNHCQDRSSPKRNSTWQQNFLNSSCLDTQIQFFIFQKAHRALITQCQKPRTPFCSCSTHFRRGFFWKKLSTPTLHTSRTRWKPACQLLPKACHLQEGTHGKPTSASRIRRKKYIFHIAVVEENISVNIQKFPTKGFVQVNISNVTPNKNGTGEGSSWPSYFAVCLQVLAILIILK